MPLYCCAYVSACDSACACDCDCDNAGKYDSLIPALSRCCANNDFFFIAGRWCTVDIDRWSNRFTEGNPVE